MSRKTLNNRCAEPEILVASDDKITYLSPYTKVRRIIDRDPMRPSNFKLQKNMDMENNNPGEDEAQKDIGLTNKTENKEKNSAEKSLPTDGPVSESEADNPGDLSITDIKQNQ